MRAFDTHIFDKLSRDRGDVIEFNTYKQHDGRTTPALLPLDGHGFWVIDPSTCFDFSDNKYGKRFMTPNTLKSLLVYSITHPSILSVRSFTLL